MPMVDGKKFPYTAAGSINFNPDHEIALINKKKLVCL